MGLINYKPALRILKNDLAIVSGERERLFLAMSVVLLEGLPSESLAIIENIQKQSDNEDLLESLIDQFYYKLALRENKRNLEQRLTFDALDLDNLPFDKKETYSLEELVTIIKELITENKRLDQALLTVISKLPISERSDSKEKMSDIKKLFEIRIS